MAKADFDRLIKEQQQQADERLDVSKMREEWLDHIANLYLDIEEFLKEYKDKKQVTTDYERLIITEESLGRYETQIMHINIVSKSVILEPAARIVIGSMGRVDIVGTAGNSRLVRLYESTTARNVVSARVRIAGKKYSDPVAIKAPSENEAIVWRLVAPPPNFDFFELTQENFLTMLAEISNG